MSRHEIDKAIFASAREWRRLRAMIAANVRHCHAERAQELREVLGAAREIALMRGLTQYAPGAFELGTEHADSFYEAVDEWTAIRVPSFRRTA
jgi:hypothetical protein